MLDKILTFLAKQTALPLCQKTKEVAINFPPFLRNRGGNSHANIKIFAHFKNIVLVPDYIPGGIHLKWGKRHPPFTQASAQRLCIVNCAHIDFKLEPLNYTMQILKCQRVKSNQYRDSYLENRYNP